VPLALNADARGSAQASASQAASQATPLVDGSYLYSQLYTMATSFSYRISGADGPPQDPSSPFNLPPTVNGWQELVAHWKNALTSEAANGTLASFATVTDHYFRRPGGYRFDSDDAEVTLPGASCPAERVLVAGHPDEMPVPTRIVDEINSGSTSGTNGFGAARRDITDSNLGNEGAYDGLSGVALTRSSAVPRTPIRPATRASRRSTSTPATTPATTRSSTSTTGPLAPATAQAAWTSRRRNHAGRSNSPPPGPTT
jgi:hypothetical protein